MKRSPEERHAQTHENLRYFDDHRCLSQSEENVYYLLIKKDICDNQNICVLVCAFPPEISSFFGKRFPFLFPFFVLSILWYFPFHVVSFYFSLYLYSLQQCSRLSEVDAHLSFLVNSFNSISTYFTRFSYYYKNKE